MAEGFGKDIQTSSTKVSQLRKALAIEGAEDADLIMMNILQIFNETDLVPDAGKFYTFIYQAKTPKLEYDEIKVKNPATGVESTVVLEGLASFFG